MKHKVRFPHKQTSNDVVKEKKIHVQLSTTCLYELTKCSQKLWKKLDDSCV